MDPKLKKKETAPIYRPSPDEMAIERQRQETEALQAKAMEFTGVVKGFIYRPHNGFANYAIATFQMEKGQIKSVDISQPHAAFEARAHMETEQAYQLEKMRRAYPAEFRHV